VFLKRESRGLVGKQGEQVFVDGGGGSKNYKKNLGGKKVDECTCQGQDGGGTRLTVKAIAHVYDLLDVGGG